MDFKYLTCTIIVLDTFFIAWLIYRLVAWLTYSRFIARNEGKEFFVYEGRKRSGNYVKDDIVPLLEPEIEAALVINKAETIYSRSGHIVISEALREVRDYVKGKGYPIVMKISEGRILCRSLNMELYRSIDKGDNPERFIQEVNRALEELRAIAAEKPVM